MQLITPLPRLQLLRLDPWKINNDLTVTYIKTEW